MKKTKQSAHREKPEGTRSRLGKAGRPNAQAPEQIAGDVMTHERRDRRSLDRHAERAAKTKRKVD